MSPETQLLMALKVYLNDGWRPFQGVIKDEFNMTLPCLSGGGDACPFWIYRGDIYLCIGCQHTCTADRPKEFLHVEKVQHKETEFQLSPMELIRRRHTLRVSEVAYCLNISEELVYKKIAMGELVALKENPKRVRASDVETLMNDFDE